MHYLSAINNISGKPKTEGRLKQDLSLLNETSIEEAWKEFFQERGALAIWNQVQRKRRNLEIINPEFNLYDLDIFSEEETWQQADEVAEGFIKYLIYHPEPKIGALSSDGYNTSYPKTITCLPTSIRQLTNLTHLTITNTCLTSLPIDIYKLPNLRHINLKTNQFQQLPEVILQRGTEFSCDNNPWYKPEELEKLDLTQLLLYYQIPYELRILSFSKLQESVSCMPSKYLSKLPSNLSQLPQLDLIQRLSTAAAYHQKLPCNLQLLHVQSLTVLCADVLAKQQHPDYIQDLIEKSLPQDLQHAERIELINQKCHVEESRIVYFKQFNNQLIPFSLARPLCTLKDVENIFQEFAKGKIDLYLVPQRVSLNE
ncbi:MAG: hypothetical protein BGO68_01395 [Candidatus Amoebophilus sp. 36-38]|nr:MAG: hypothetical protein BGO68_01395 [Candidatus Amoebophilus sp. 36-38]